MQQEFNTALPNDNTSTEVQQPLDQGKQQIQVYSRRNRSLETDTAVPITSPTDDCSETEVPPPSPSIYLPIAVRKGTRSCTQHPISRFVSYGNLSKSYKAFVTNVDSIKIPKNIEEALESAEWRQAVMEEMKALKNNETWEVSDLPKGKKTVGCKWIFTTKFKPDGRIDRYKARLVAKGFTQTYGLDYNETFAPVAKLNTARVLLSLAANLDWHLTQLDVKNAFLNGELNEEVYMDFPPGFEENKDQVCKLKKSLYGLKQSPRAWFSRFAKAMTSRNYIKGQADHTMFYKHSEEACPVCYLPVDQAIASMPSSPSASPVLQNLTYVHDENPIKTEPHGGSDFGGYPSIKQRSDSFDVKESMTVHCGFVKRSKPGLQTGFDFDESDVAELQQFHDIIVASAIFGNYDVIQQPRNISEEAKKNIPFYMFIDEETEAYIKKKSILDSSKRVGLWRIVVVRNVPYSDARRNGKVPKLLLHRIFPNVRYSIWIDGKLQLVVDPYQILEKFLWRQNANFAISRHYRRFDVFVEAEANKAAGKYDNSSIDEQVDFYKQEGLTPYSEAKFPITSAFWCVTDFFRCS
ncbi:uncharacterized protein [Gossypium hirsutum]|uniref:Uncharacterized protein isoform X6 n=1 Tax=Gossypium hirsutum TaxID=3635 RepID=A0ABM3A079_GOSHI|nr:uncharacterized protein LOC107903567 isoform X6 [Gossypium hirsutum]